jgi:hypothetical protein
MYGNGAKILGIKTIQMHLMMVAFGLVTTTNAYYAAVLGFKKLETAVVPTVTI